jgi:hypothetical protein
VSVWIVLGWLVWLATIGASATINIIAGQNFATSGVEAHVFAVLGLAADGWKAIGPIFVVGLWRAKRRTIAALATALWAVCFTYAMTNALGLAAQTRSGTVAGREDLAAAFEATVTQLKEIDERRSRLTGVRSRNEIEAEMRALLVEPVSGRGIVGTLSQDCTHDTWRTRTACARYAQLAQEKSAAEEFERLDHRRQELAQKAETYRAQGSRGPADAQADLIVRFSGGYIARGDVGLFVVLLLVAMIELISAFTPVILNEVRHATRALQANADTSAEETTITTERDGATDLYEFIRARLRPDSRARVTPGALFDDYQAWRLAQGRLAPDRAGFFSEFERVVRNDLKNFVCCDNGVYCGFALCSRNDPAESKRTKSL